MGSAAGVLDQGHYESSLCHPSSDKVIAEANLFAEALAIRDGTEMCEIGHVLSENAAAKCLHCNALGAMSAHQCASSKSARFKLLLHTWVGEIIALHRSISSFCVIVYFSLKICFTGRIE